MSLLYKNKKDQTLKIRIRKTDKVIQLIFSKDCGVFGTDEMIDTYSLTPGRLLQILQDRDDYTEDEL